MAQITIVGSGMAACQLVRDIRKKQSTASIEIVSPNLCHNYAKPQLSMLCRTKRHPHDIISLSHEEFCRTFDVSFTQNSVLSIDHLSQTFCLANEDEKKSFSKLILAHGAAPNLPFEHTENTFFLENALELHKKLSPSSKVAIIGGGLIGCELADDLSHKIAGQNIDMYFAQEGLLSSYVPPQVGDQLKSLLQAKGINLYNKSKIQSVKKENEKFFIDDHDGAYDLVICSLGMRVNNLGSTLPIDRGFLADKNMKIEKNIYGLGDCIQAQGRYLPYIAPMVEQSKILANQLTDGQGDINPKPNVYTVNVKTPSLPIAIIGDKPLVPGQLEFEEKDEGVFFGWSHGKLKQIYLVGHTGLSKKMALLTDYHDTLSRNLVFSH